MVRAVLFDLDGTLADTAPDLADALNLLRQRRGLPPLAQPVIRPHASHGARGLLHIGFGLSPEDKDFPALREALLDAYAANLCNRTRLFPGIDAVLRQLEQRRMPWGVVTNKPARFTQPLIDRLGLTQRAATVISG
ncbi:MAG TPA: phosphoglycolate phosphatase, partial [Betaproteobacteria bacterium]|nr:phosphoglycolate phosphatase [Betaproteobacteria bacterium]